MGRRLPDYRKVVGDQAIAEIYRKARKLYGTRFLHINSTYYGGGVAEILRSFVPLLNDAGIRADWRIIPGSPDFFDTTKKFHNALQGDGINMTKIKKELYIRTNQDFASYCTVEHDFVIIHDPQPLPLISFYRKNQPWFWRCHVDLSAPNKELWDFLKGFILRYDVVIVSSEDYKSPDLPVEQKIIHPAIDPLSPKNMDLDDATIAKYLRKFRIPMDKPIILQVSRFDKWKDPEGVLEIFSKVKEEVDCRLILCGSMALDDPEGVEIYNRVRRKVDEICKDNPDCKRSVILITSENNILVNILQRISAVVIQKSLREGFGLSVTEALWKGKPVVASRVGGIPIQIVDGETGFLLDPYDYDGFARKIIEIIKNPDMAREVGAKAKEYVRERFLITRLIVDYLDLLNEML